MQKDVGRFLGHLGGFLLMRETKTQIPKPKFSLDSSVKMPRSVAFTQGSRVRAQRVRMGGRAVSPAAHPSPPVTLLTSHSTPRGSWTLPQNPSERSSPSSQNCEIASASSYKFYSPGSFVLF